MVLDEEGRPFIVVDGTPIAKRGEPNSPQARTWVTIEPGWRVLDRADGALVIEFSGVRVH
jgi:hypothetical protein